MKTAALLPLFNLQVSDKKTQFGSCLYRFPSAQVN